MPDRRPLAGKAALVTGGSRGIGAGIAARLAADGALVAVHHSASPERALEVVRTIEAAGGSAFAVRHELAGDDPHALADAVEREVAQRLGTGRLDILVNNAATADPAPFEDVTPASFDRLFAVNVRGTFFLTQAVLPLIPQGGRIIAISSAVSRVMVPGTVAYAMGKAALENLCWWLAKDLGPRGITVNAVSPGVIATELATQTMGEEGMRLAASLSPFGRVGQVEDVAEVVGFLASDGAAWVTGQVIDASGGHAL